MKTEHTSEFALPRRVCWCSQICNVVSRRPSIEQRLGGALETLAPETLISKITGIEFWCLQWIRLAKASWKMVLVSENLQILPPENQTLICLSAAGAWCGPITCWILMPISKSLQLFFYDFHSINIMNNCTLKISTISSRSQSHHAQETQ